LKDDEKKGGQDIWNNIFTSTGKALKGVVSSSG
jgi:hypothetical protein